jgi:hypothetical protein
MKITVTICCLTVVLLLIGCIPGGPTNPIPPDGPNCVHYYTCSEGSDYGCNPDAPVDFCATLGMGRCSSRGCVPQPGQVAPSAAGVGIRGIKFTCNAAGQQGGYFGIQKVDHGTGRRVGNAQYIKVAPGRSANEVAKDFCSLANFLGIYCTSQGNEVSFYNHENGQRRDIYYYTNLSNGEDRGFQ